MSEENMSRCTIRNGTALSNWNRHQIYAVNASGKKTSKQNNKENPMRKLPMNEFVFFPVRLCYFLGNFQQFTVQEITSVDMMSQTFCKLLQSNQLEWSLFAQFLIVFLYFSFIILTDFQCNFFVHISILMAFIHWTLERDWNWHWRKWSGGIRTHPKLENPNEHIQSTQSTQSTQSNIHK